MNRPIIRLFGLVVLLFALLIAFTSRWTIFEASSLRDNSLNKRAVLEQQHIDRGPIVAADGTVLAHSLRRAEGIYERSRTPSATTSRTSAAPAPSGSARTSSTARPTPASSRSSTSCRAANHAGRRS